MLMRVFLQETNSDFKFQFTWQNFSLILSLFASGFCNKFSTIEAIFFILLFVVVAFCAILGFYELIVVRFYRGGNADIIIVIRWLIILNLRNWAWRSFDDSVSENTCPIGTIISSIDFIVIRPFPLTSTICLTIVALEDIVSSSC
jgi:hypothetical protein